MKLLWSIVLVIFGSLLAALAGLELYDITTNGHGYDLKGKDQDFIALTLVIDELYMLVCAALIALSIIIIHLGVTHYKKPR